MVIKQSDMDVLINIIGAVETGGQIYGKRRYDDYTPAYANCSNEVSCTIGAFQEYGSLAKGLLKEILNTFPITFRKYDNAGIEKDLQLKTWNGYSPNPESAKAKAIVKIINSPDGRIVQDKRIERQMRDYIAFANSKGVTEIDALFMCANFIHQGGYSACTRILGKTSKPYTLDKLYESCKTDTGNQVGAYRTRQSKVYGWLKQYLSNTEKGGNETMGITAEQAINAVINCAKEELGYLEKASNAQLDSKKANAGKSNYTKYWRDLKPSWNGSYWCAVFVSWVFAVAFGMKTAKKLLKHELDFPYVYCPTLSKRFKLYANPKRGDVVIFYRGGEFKHTGIVTKVVGDKFWTIEGNTSSGTEIIPNGGEVCEKSYYNSQLPGTKFCRPDYSIVKEILSKNPFGENVNDPSSVVINKPLNKTVKFKGVITASTLNVRTKPSIDTNTCSFSPLKKGTVVEVCDEINGWYYIKYNGKFGFSSAKYIEKDSSKDIEPKPNAQKEYSNWVGYCTKDVANVYEQSKGDSILDSYPKLAKANLVDVIGESGNRYKIKIAEKYIGYVSMFDIHNKNKKFPSVGTVVTNGSTLNLRKKAVTGDVIAKIPNGTKVIVKGTTTKTPDKSRWFKVKHNGKTGFVSGQYLRTI